MKLLVTKSGKEFGVSFSEIFWPRFTQVFRVPVLLGEFDPQWINTYLK